MNELPFITVVMPVRNEARFIADTLGQLRGQDYPKDRFEILVADGMSDDGTRDIVARIAKDDERVRLLDNPKRRSSAGRNMGFRAGRGDFFVVVDGHCHIPDDKFLCNIAECFEKSGGDCLGRPQPLDPPGLTPFQKSVALARASRLGHGGDSLIYGEYEGFASPVSNGAAYRREVFERVGYVDEDFDACEDVEFNYRVEQAGLKSYSSPKLTVRYYPRENLTALISQMRGYGRGRTRLYRKHPALLSLSALVPACFAGGAAAFAALLGLDLIFGLSAFLSFIFSALGLALLAYAALVGMATVRTCREHGWDHALRMPLIFWPCMGGWGLACGRSFGSRPGGISSVAGGPTDRCASPSSLILSSRPRPAPSVNCSCFWKASTAANSSPGFACCSVQRGCTRNSDSARCMFSISALSNLPCLGGGHCFSPSGCGGKGWIFFRSISPIHQKWEPWQHGWPACPALWLRARTRATG